ncbi:hypothetical protein H9Y04_19535 [Streptomyces sp. TRM66268-LWL]|uniref:Lipoprotein n=1 Tax=Streptomyces polyasparticus TaxID=2767826 RepID=A0ABR7SIG0_9ACTN|nr:hypothetical protein [Streptomyces polyasparticus]MBC9714749.1 hypothetical protein [Streptomyces polyasparticus]
MAAAVLALGGCGALPGGESPDPYTSVIPAPTSDSRGGGEEFVFSSGSFEIAEQDDVAKGQPCEKEGAFGVGPGDDRFRCHDAHWVLLVWEPPEAGSSCPVEGQQFFQRNEPTHQCRDGRWEQLPG